MGRQKSITLWCVVFRNHFNCIIYLVVYNFFLEDLLQKRFTKKAWKFIIKNINYIWKLGLDLLCWDFFDLDLYILSICKDFWIFSLLVWLLGCLFWLESTFFTSELSKAGLYLLFFGGRSAVEKFWYSFLIKNWLRGGLKSWSLSLFPPNVSCRCGSSPCSLTKCCLRILSWKIS